MKRAAFFARKRVLFPLLGIFLLLVYLLAAILDGAALLPQIPQLGSDTFIREKLKLETWLPLPNISDGVVAAIIVSEDVHFFQHPGYDIDSIRYAIKKNISRFKYKWGASTISQQVVKNVFLNREKTLKRKIEELILAHRMEETFGKDRIMEIYLNTAQFGPKLNGVDKASDYYFNKSASELTAKEGAFLAMLLPSPVRYGKSFAERKLTRYAKKTVASILKRMADEGYISARELEEELPRPLSFENDITESATTPISSGATPTATP
jgi:monofunctional glycosyltransferase